MKNYAYGFPRIGKNREFKKAIEGFWKGELTEAQLAEAISSLEKERIRVYAGSVDLFPAGEMTLYDKMLDTAIIFGVYPRPKDLNGYFDLCRGKSALEMSKWFNTNYHYLIPEIKDPGFKFTAADAFSVGVARELPEPERSFYLEPTQPAPPWRGSALGLPGNYPNLNSATFYIIGPFTFLKLSKGWDRTKLNLYLENLSRVYAELLNCLKSNGVKAVHLEEPALVMDLTPEEIKAVKKVYQALGNCGIDLYLFTYYESVDFLPQLYELPVKAIGLDFVHGPDNLKNLKGFPKDKFLIAGVVSGRNVWRTDLEKALKLIAEIKNSVSDEQLFISNAGPLYHLPVSLEGEKFEEALTLKLTFAQERLKELSLLKSGTPEAMREWSKGTRESLGEDEGVRQEVKKLKEEDFARKAPYKERIKTQQAELKLPLFPTTTIGSFPQTKEVREKRQAYRSGKISAAEYKEYIQGEIKKLVDFQEKIGLDVLVHGEFERTDMVEFFAEKLKGMATSKNGWIISYGTRAYRPPIIYGDVKREKPMTLEELLYAQSLTQKPVKGMLTGPVTILGWSFVREDIPLSQVAYQIGLALREEIDDLERAGIKIIQVDEPAFREKMPIKKRKAEEYFKWATRSFRLCAARVKPSTQIHAHMCYSEFGEIISEIYQLDADVISIEASRSRGDILEAFERFNYDRQIGLGVWDIHSPSVPSIEDMKAVVTRSLKSIPKENFWINPDCGLKTRGWEEVIPSLQNMVQLARELR